MLIDNILSQADVSNQQYRVFICKVNGEIIREITKQTYNISYNPQLGGADSFSFEIPKEYDNKPVLNYSDIVGRNLILVKKGTVDLDYFEIQGVKTQTEGITEVKSVSTLSAEIKLIHKKIFLTSGVFKLVNNTTPSQGILNTIVKLSPSWSIGTIDNALINMERYFDVVESNAYELLINDVQDTFGCVITFNTVNKTINATALENYGTERRIILSLNNLLESSSKNEISEDVVTRLHLYGSNDLTVRDVNLGSTYIQNLGYFKNTRFMSQSLINALNAYEIKIANSQSTYSSYLATLQGLNTQLVTYNSELDILNGELTSLLEQRAYLQSINQPTTTIQVQITNKTNEVNTKTGQINTVNSSITATQNSVDALIGTLAIESNFTIAQIKELDNFIIEDTYQDQSFLITDTMTYNEIVVIQKQLYDAGVKILQRVSYPRYKIDIALVDFLQLPEYSSWWNELIVGDIITIDVEDFIVKVRVTGYSHNWDSNSLTISLGDRYQLDDANIELLELIKSSMSAGTSINYNKYKYGDYSNNGKNEILSFINSSLDVAKNTIISGSGVGVQIDTTGILATLTDPNTQIVSPKQLRISNNGIVLTDDGFVTAKTAIGQLVNGQYGIAAEIIAGKMILGNNMIIETGAGDFRVDGSGVNITKMALNLTSADNLKKIQLDPNVGFKIQSRANTSQVFSDKFFIDSSGRLKFDGDLIAGSINIGNGNFVVDQNGNLTSNTVNAQFSVVDDQIDSIVGVNNAQNTRITQTESSITSLVTSVDGVSSRVTQTESSITSLVTTTNNHGTRITQTESSITSLVFNSNEQSSQITQLSNEITLKVSVGNVISSINLESGGVTINANRIDLNGITKVNNTLFLGSPDDDATLYFNSLVFMYGTDSYVADPSKSFWAIYSDYINLSCDTLMQKGSLVATQDWVNFNYAPFFHTHTQYVQNMSNQNLRMQYFNGFLEVWDGSTFIGKLDFV